MVAGCCISGLDPGINGSVVVCVQINAIIQITICPSIKSQVPERQI